jgi:hypothetical protein
MSVKWLNRGTASKAMQQQEQAEQAARKAASGKMFRFFLKPEEECQITFVDGNLSPEGILLPPRYFEHTVEQGGKYVNYVCPEKTRPDEGYKCPICEQGDRPALVALFTVIDHRTFKSKDGTKTYANRPKLFVAKPITFDMLNKLAQKRGGLANCTFDVSRVGDKSAAVGSMFDFREKHTDIEALKEAFQMDVIDPQTGKVTGTKTAYEPADYDSEIVFMTDEELRGLGFGKTVQTGVSFKPGGAAKKAAASDDYEEHL